MNNSNSMNVNPKRSGQLDRRVTQFRNGLSKNKRISIDKNELKKLVFWAHVGTLYSQGGSHSKEIPTIIVKCMKKLNLKPNQFCMFKNPEFKMLARDVYVRWSDTIGKGK